MFNPSDDGWDASFKAATPALPSRATMTVELTSA
jgi:hypothetical protein